MTKKKVKQPNKKEELELRKREIWEKFKTLNYDNLTEEQRLAMARTLYETMTFRVAPPVVSVGFDFWKEYENCEEVKDLEKFRTRIENTLNGLPKNPNPVIWFDRERGIIQSMKKELKEKIEPFTTEHVLRKKIRDKIEDFINNPENKDKEMSFNLDAEMKQAIENIEESVYKPIRAKIDEIEEEIKKRN